MISQQYPFSDDTFLYTVRQNNYNIMLQELSDESSRMGWKINKAKIKVMSVDNISLSLNNMLIENVEGYVYFNRTTFKHGNKYVQHHIQALKVQRIGRREDKSPQSAI